MKIAVCDDSAVDRGIAVELLNDYADNNSLHFDISNYETGESLIYDTQEGICFDVVFLDVYMDGILGIDTAHKLRENNFEGDIVFLTSTSEFAVESYDVDAAGYLMKPHSKAKLSAVMDKILYNYHTKTYPVRIRSNIINIPVNEILFAESCNTKCVIHRKGNKKYTVYKKLNEIESELSDRRFLRCHQSYLVNMDYIEKADKDFTLTSGDIIGIRQRDLKSIRRSYLDYINKH